VVDEGLAARRALMITGPLYCPVSNPPSSLLKSYLEVDRGPVDFVFPKTKILSACLVWRKNLYHLTSL
jgi:hypothetical protein